jgi:hypothetical protein
VRRRGTVPTPESHTAILLMGPPTGPRRPFPRADGMMEDNPLKIAFARVNAVTRHLGEVQACLSASAARVRVASVERDVQALVHRLKEFDGIQDEWGRVYAEYKSATAALAKVLGE